jgi:hypothetical protein
MSFRVPRLCDGCKSPGDLQPAAEELVSWRSSSSHHATDAEDKQVTENEELVSWFSGWLTAANF